MDVVVADIPPKFGVFLSISWTSKLKGSLQMDMSYATIHVLNENKRLYSEKRSPYVVSSPNQSGVNYIYAVDTDLGSSIFFNGVSPCDSKVVVPNKAKKDKNVMNEQEALERKQKEEGVWTMYFDGSVAKVGAGAGVYIISPIRDFKAFFYKLTFECTNNVAK